MKLQDALQKMSEHQKKTALAADMSEVVSLRYGAYMTLFNAAVMANDKTEIERLRGVLHDFLDQILDAGFDVHTHQREMKALVQFVDREPE